jgi:hypothetical protein
MLSNFSPKELTERELLAVIQGCEPWEVTRDLTEEELDDIFFGGPNRI